MSEPTREDFLRGVPSDKKTATDVLPPRLLVQEMYERQEAAQPKRGWFYRRFIQGANQ